MEFMAGEKGGIKYSTLPLHRTVGLLGACMFACGLYIVSGGRAFQRAAVLFDGVTTKYYIVDTPTTAASTGIKTDTNDVNRRKLMR